MYNGLAHTGTGALLLTVVAAISGAVGALLKVLGVRR
jgi:hypothetical protein